MSVYFGTDGIRGEFSVDNLLALAFLSGRALGVLKPGAKILIGCDTRQSNDTLVQMFSAGALCVGANVTSVGVCPTAGVSFLTLTENFDFGVVVSASHNPAKFNGIKIFDKNGEKITQNFETEIEKTFFKQIDYSLAKKGVFKCDETLIEKYTNFLAGVESVSLKNKTIVLDTANGAAFKIAPLVFKKLGAKVVVISGSPNGNNINKNCGATNVKKLKNTVLKIGADMGFAFDGDSDRVIAVAENGRVVDGDQIVYLFALDLKNNNQLKNNAVVGTVLTNMGIEKALECKNIKLIRADVGDRNVSECLKSNNLLVGGEQSGHVIVTNKLATGDGILNALLVASICVKSKLTLSQLLNVELFHQSCQNVEVKNKSKIMHSQTLINAQKYEEKIMGKNGRILIRASGTEPCIRVMVESIDQKLAGAVCERLSAVVHKIDLTENLCVE